MIGEVAIRLEGLSKSFGGVRAVRDVTLDVRSGEILALAGANGAGKSTLAAMASGALKPDSGSISLGGHTYDALSPVEAVEHGVVIIRQEPEFVPTLSVAENLALGRENARFGIVSRRRQRRRAFAALRRIGVELDPDTSVGDLSPALRQQVEIARALAQGEAVAFFDEPTAALGPGETEVLFDLIRRLAAEGVGIVYVSHRLEEIFAVCDRVAVLRDGELVTDRAIHELDEDALVELIAGRHLDRPEARSALGRRGEEVMVLAGVSSRGQRLDDVDLELRKGEVHGVFGIVGAGRTRLARLLVGLEALDSGSMTLDGARYSPSSPHAAGRHGVMMVPEDRKNAGVFAMMTAAYNLTASRPPSGAAGWITHRRELGASTDLMERLDLRPRAPRQPGSSFSGGNQQKLVLGRAIAVADRVLVVDEPTRGVDIGAKSEIHRQIRERVAAGVAVLVISSDLEELLEYCDVITVMSRGTVVADFQPPFDHVAIVAAATRGDTKERTGG
ncbi:MAG: sugar ABC transporter ATP-binding protein [Acidimicrobiales bacterium]